MNANNHIIQRFTVQLNLPDSRQSGKMRTELIAFIESGVKDQLERTFDEISPSNETIRVEKISLDLGTISRANLHQKLSEELRNSISKAILAAKKGQSSVNSGQIKIQFAENQQSVIDATTNQLNSAPNNFWESFAYFLKTGSYAWWSRLNDKMPLERYFQQYCIHAENSTVSKGAGGSTRELLWGLISTHTKALKRLVFQMDLEQIDLMILEESQQKGINLIPLHNWMLDFIESRVKINRKSAIRLLRVAEIHFLLKLETGNEEQLIQWLLRLFTIEYMTYNSSKNKVVKEIENWIHNDQNNDRGIKTLKFQKQSNVLFHALKESKLTAFPSLKELDEFDHNMLESAQLIPEQIQKEAIELQNKEATEKDPSHTSAIQLNYAGVIILWPMLTTFFDRLGLTSEQMFKDQEKQFRAIKMLNYVVSGADVFPAYEMPLNKILCGVPVSEPFFSPDNLNDKEKEEAEALLKHVIQAWSVLKSTSPNGLREAFIQRKGELIEKEECWLLKVESISIDIIMSKLPWGISMVKLPWMEKIIQVEW